MHFAFDYNNKYWLVVNVLDFVYYIKKKLDKFAIYLQTYMYVTDIF